MLYPRERRFRRYNLEFPVSLSFSADGQTHELETMSKNVSTGGVLLRASKLVPLHTAVALTMQVKGSSARRPIQLMAEGEVVRVEGSGAESGFAIAIECRHPITELERPGEQLGRLDTLAGEQCRAVGREPAPPEDWPLYIAVQRLQTGSCRTQILG